MNNGPDGFQLLDRDEAVWVGCFLIGLAAIAFGRDEVPPQPAPQPVAQRQCPQQWIAQSGDGEPATLVCVVADLTVLREMPNWILTSPMGKQ